MYIRSPFPHVPPLPPTNFHNLLFRGADTGTSDYVLHIDGITGEKRTHSEFLARVYDGATALGAPKEAGGLGLTSNDMIGILSDNCLDYVVLVHSLLAITTPFALCSSHATPREMSYSLTKSKTTHVFVHASLLSKFLPVAREQGLSEDNVYILEGRSQTDRHPVTFGQMIQNVRDSKIPREPVRKAGKDTLAYLAFSSGTSGLPKVVMTSHGNINFTLIQGAELAKVTTPPSSTSAPSNTPVVLAALPFFFVAGLHFNCLSRFYAQWNEGGPMRPKTHVIMPRWDLELALNLIPKYRVSTIGGVPSIIHQLVHSPLAAKTDLSSINAISSGAAYLHPKLEEEVKKLLPATAIVFAGYGMSEGTIATTWGPMPGFPPDIVENVPGSIGNLLPGMEAMILRSDGTHCLPNEPGELYVKGDNVALGYLNNPEATRQTFIADSWLRTGDHVKANLKGTFWFEDRVKDTLKVSGMQVSPAEIEDVLLDTPGELVTDVAVAGVQAPGARTSDDNSPRAWVVLSAQGRHLGEQQARDALNAWTKTNLSKYKWLRGGIQFVEAIPKSATGKTLRRVLQEQYAADALSRAKL